jgi:cytochrome c-type biogenesis protein
LLHGREYSFRVLGKVRRRTLGTIASGMLLVAMGALTVVIAFTGPDMGTSGWRVRVAANLQHWAAVTTRALSWLPGWIFALILVAVAALIAAQLRRSSARRRDAGAGLDEPAAHASEVGEAPQPGDTRLERVPRSDR